MRRRAALAVLLVLAGVVSLGALLMWGPFITGTSVFAGVDNPLGVGRNHDPDVGTVRVWNDETDLHFQYLITHTTPYERWCLREVHVCVSDNPFTWVAPGSEKKCEKLGGVHRSFASPALCLPRELEFSIPLADLGGLDAVCPSLYVQAHAAVLDYCTWQVETAYANVFKSSYEQDLSYCDVP